MKSPRDTKLPVVLALHGGNRNAAKWSADTGSGMKRFVDAGFIVIGVQYRGVDGGEGMEQFGGDAVHDVVNAVAMARHLPEADGRNVFMWGASRGRDDGFSRVARWSKGERRRHDERHDGYGVEREATS